MSNDTTTLADVQPGGRVRLGDEPWPDIDMILADAYSAGAEGLQFEGIARRAAVRAAVAALAARQPVGEPVAYMVRWKTVGGFGLVRLQDMKYYHDLHDEYEIVPLYREVPPAQAVDLWQPIETAPKNGSSMLLGYVNSAGNWRTVRGRWFSAEKIEMEWENADDFEAGWYEESVEADDIPNVWPTTPTHWQPLPAAPRVDSKAVGNG